ncbi:MULTISPECIES: DUF6691 family protein [Flavobacteriaceae]|uniref:DUF6691 family protein n=1 Tax=Flavobacteriaceae TaxID=49546 RepID=UPI001491681B|nr:MULTISPECIES: DUF6691 family protein [Allomuricauda]MDC6366217.1 YeeE/YedE thiosulfate transporter family protein [Muricauda sp. AC10]
MRSLGFVIVGIFFGVVLYKSEAASWFRIYEMFQFDSFHMYGIISSAVLLGVIFVQWVKRSESKSFFGEQIKIADKERSFTRYAVGGILFGLGWALAGACPGPMYVLAGAGFWTILIVLFGAILGAFLYGVLRDKLPH